MAHGIEACVLCGSETSDRAMSLVEWTEPVGNSRYAHIPRCVDRAACRHQVEVVLGEPWPVADRTPAPEKPAAVAPVDPPPADPLPPEPAAPPVVEPVLEEVLPWRR